MGMTSATRRYARSYSSSRRASRARRRVTVTSAGSSAIVSAVASRRGPGFETRAVEQLKQGEAYYDEEITEDGKRYLQAATAIPVVMPKCVMCHPHYEDAKPGAAIGAMSYRIPIE